MFRPLQRKYRLHILYVLYEIVDRNSQCCVKKLIHPLFVIQVNIINNEQCDFYGCFSKHNDDVTSLGNFINVYLYFRIIHDCIRQDRVFEYARELLGLPVPA